MKKLLFLIPIVILVFIFVLMSGYRFTNQSAVEANPFLEKGAILEQKVKSNLGEVFIYKVKNYFLTILPQKKGLLWFTPNVTTTKDINDKNDKVRTIGWVSCQIANKSMTLIVVDVKDDKVAYIEAGLKTERIKKKVINGKPVVFEWNRGYFAHDIEPIALSENDEKLYKYGYNPLTPNFTDTKELRWYKMLLQH